jgi:hypothetical protein
MAAFRDLTGQKFGKWTVVRWDSKKYAQQFWLCVCDCGTEKVVVGDSLKKGLSKSCGCAGKDWCRTHGMEGTPTYTVWAGMIQRCHNPNARSYKHYGNRGIKVCDAWRNSFTEFFNDMGAKPDGLSLDRINNDGDYEPSNCRWATGSQQKRNRRTTTFLTYQGKTQSVSDWAESIGLPRKILERRVRDKWPLERILFAERYGRWGPIT